MSAHKDFNKPLRTSIFTTLDGNLTYPAGQTAVEVHDLKAKKANNNTNYVLISGMSSNNTSTFSGYMREMNFELTVVVKNKGSVTRDIADEIAGQILALLITDQQQTGFADTADFGYNNIQLNTDRYLEIDLADDWIITQRIMGFSITMNQK